LKRAGEQFLPATDLPHLHGAKLGETIQGILTGAEEVLEIGAEGQVRAIVPLELEGK
jgi:hypothetical protein